MPRFLARLLSAQNPFRASSSPAAQGQDMQRARRVLVRNNATGGLEDAPTHWRFSLFDASGIGGGGDAEEDGEEHVALRKGEASSVADGDDVHVAAAQPILAFASPLLQETASRPVRTRRKLSKKRTRPS